jgi:hypothetical protein
VIAIIRYPKNSCGGKCLGEELYVARDPLVNAAATMYPDVFVGLCMAARRPVRHIDSKGSHAIQPIKQAFFHECKSLVDGNRGARNGSRAAGRRFRRRSRGHG